MIYNTFFIDVALDVTPSAEAGKIKAPENLEKFLGANPGRILNLPAPPLTNLPNNSLAPDNRLGWGLCSDGIPHADILKQISRVWEIFQIPNRQQVRTFCGLCHIIGKKYSGNKFTFIYRIFTKIDLLFTKMVIFF